MDDIINRGIVYGTHPPKGIYFTVSVEYNPTHSVFEGKMDVGTGLESNPIRTFPEAMDASDLIVQKLRLDEWSDATINEIDPMENEGFHTMIMGTDALPIARVGVVTHDYRTAIIH